jgi:hypothetical protein
MHRHRSWPLAGSTSAAFRQRSRAGSITTPSDADFTLDFTTGSLPNFVTVARTVGNATIINSRGLIQTVSANTGRFTYNPVNLGARPTLLVEPTATNICLDSQTIQNWSGGQFVTRAANTTDVTDPAGTNTATKMTVTAGQYCSVFQQITVTSGTQYVFSFWIRGTAGNTIRIFDVTNSANIVTDQAISYTTTGWTRVSTTFTTPISCTSIYVYTVNLTAVSADVYYVWGAQLELGPAPTSYIATTGIALQRDNDLVTLNYNAISRSMPFSVNQGTLLINATFQNPSFLSQYPAVFGFCTSAGANLFGLTYSDDLLNSGYTAFLQCQTGTLTAPSLGGGLPITSGTAFRLAMSFSSTTTSSSLLTSTNGVTSDSGTTPEAPRFTGIASFRINLINGSNIPVMNMSRIQYWNRNFSQAQLNALTR